MALEEKELLLKDLCGRLPYGVLFQDMRWTKTAPSTMGILDYWRMECKIYGDEPYRPIEQFKMYLRPLSSMTEIEKEEYDKFFTTITAKEANFGKWISPSDDVALIDWYNKHHFDYRGLIPMGLALEALEDMYKDN